MILARISCPFLLVLSVCGLRTGCLSAQDASLPVAVAEVVGVPVNTGYRVVGTVNPLRTSTIGSPVAGRVKSFDVVQGQAVQAGQQLAQLQIETLNIELLAAKSELNLYEQQLAELENGSRVEEIAEAEANAMGAKAAMENAASQLRRMETLVATRAATDTDMEDARERARLTQFSYAAADALFQRVKAGPRPEQIAQALARVELQKHNVALIEDRKSKHTLKSPFDGYVAAEYTEVGAWISSGDPIAQVIQLDEVEIQAPVTADYATKLRLGDSIRVEIPSLPDQLLTGVVERIVPVAESRARTYPVIIRLQNSIVDGKPLLLAGMLARVDLPAGERKVVPLVPKDALVLNDRDRAVFVFEPDVENGSSGGVRRVPVELGVAKDDMIQVIGDIRPGQQVVVVGNERLPPNARVTVIDSSQPLTPAG